MITSKSTRRLLASAAAVAATAAGLVMGLGATGLPTGSKLTSEASGQVMVRMSMPDAIRAARPAVFMIGTIDDDGGFEQIGTGFSISDSADQALVATAAHVAEKVLAAHKDGTRVVVRRPDTGSPTDFTVTADPDIHPGYTRWRTINQRKLVARTTGGYERVASMVPADVAILTTEGGLGATLDLASPEQLASLSAGGGVVYLGFPAENMFGQKTNVAPTAGFGHIQTLSGIMFAPAAPESSLVIQHDVLLTGGSSGGPLLAADEVTGRLIVIGAHSAASHVFLEDARIPLAKGYAQRADLIRELVDGIATAAQDARDDQWADEVLSVTLSAAGRLDALSSALAERFEVAELDRFSVNLAARSNAPLTLTIRVEEGTQYAFIATGTNWDDVNLSLNRGEEELSADEKPDAIPTVRWTANFTGDVELTIAAPTTYGKSAAEVRVLKVAKSK
jgi:S1-C subfamily serine protease